MKIKILYCLSDGEFTGASRHLFDLITNLNKKKFTSVLISKPSPIINALKKSIKVYSVPMANRLDFASIKTIKEIIKNEQPHIIHLHSARAGILATLAAKKLTIPIVYTEHLFTKQYQPKNRLIHFVQLKVFQSLSPYITKVIAVSQAVKKYLVTKNIFSSNKIKVIYNGIRTTVSRKRKAENKLLTLGSIGTLTELKGYRYLIEAIKIMQNEKRKTKNFRLEIVGRGDQEKKLKSLVSKYHLEKQIKFIALVKDIRAKMNDWDIYIQSSLSEAFGLALAEAMGAGLAAIATRVGGIPELVGKTALLVRSKDPKALASAIMELAHHQNLRQTMGQHARKRIINQFSLEKTVENTAALYEKILKDHLASHN